MSLNSCDNIEKLLCNIDYTDREYLQLSSTIKSILCSYCENYILSDEITADKSEDLIYDIIDYLHLREYINSVNVDLLDGFVSWYDFETKKMAINFGNLVLLNKRKYITSQTLLIEFLTVVLHEIYHVIQYKYLDAKELISVMKQVSLMMKKYGDFDKKFHDLIPDERGASIESAKLLYKFFEDDYMGMGKSAENNLVFYLTNGYANIKNVNVYPMQTLLERLHCNCFDDYSNKLSRYSRAIYGFDLADIININYLKTNHVLGNQAKHVLKI